MCDVGPLGRKRERCGRRRLRALLRGLLAVLVHPSHHCPLPCRRLSKVPGKAPGPAHFRPACPCGILCCPSLPVSRGPVGVGAGPSTNFWVVSGGRRNPSTGQNPWRMTEVLARVVCTLWLKSRLEVCVRVCRVVAISLSATALPRGLSVAIATWRPGVATVSIAGSLPYWDPWPVPSNESSSPWLPCTLLHTAAPCAQIKPSAGDDSGLRIQGLGPCRCQVARIDQKRGFTSDGSWPVGRIVSTRTTASL